MPRSVSFRCPRCGISGTALQKDGAEVFCPGNAGMCGAVCDVGEIDNRGRCNRCKQPIDEHAMDRAGVIGACPAPVKA